MVRPATYEVKRGDALVIIARKFTMEVDQLKIFNGLTNDTIRIGQVLKIPTQKELNAMAPPPAPPEKDKPKAAPKVPVVFVPTREAENVLLQAFLDRERFPTGPIDGNPGVTFEKALELYRSVHNLGSASAKSRLSRGRAIHPLRAESRGFPVHRAGDRARPGSGGGEARQGQEQRQAGARAATADL
jgi:murein DD-endopeptidase MepM/ murein hydrolase activator NlpD